MANPTNKYLTSIGLQQPSASDLTNGTTGTGAVVLASSLPIVGTAFNTGATAISANIAVGLASNTTQLYSFFFPYSVSVLSFLTYHIGNLADNSGSLYDIGIYGPGCLNGATNVPLVCHTGALPGSTICPTAATDMKIALTGGPVTVNMVPGWYAIGITGGSSNGSPRLTGEASVLHDLMFANNALPGGSTGVTSGGVLNSSITAPALVWSRGSYPAVAGF